MATIIGDRGAPGAFSAWLSQGRLQGHAHPVRRGVVHIRVERQAEDAVAQRLADRQRAGPAAEAFVCRLQMHRARVVDGARNALRLEGCRDGVAVVEEDRDRTSTRLNSSNYCASRMPSSA